MPRTVKTIKDDKGNDVEVYVDTCNVCTREMLSPKKMADELEQMFPFIKEKIEAGSPCVECTKKEFEKNKDFKLFSEEEMTKLKNKFLEIAVTNTNKE